MHEIKQLHHLLKANHFCMVSIICKSSFLSGQYAGSSLVFFANQNLSRDREAKLLRKWIALVFQVKFEQRPMYQETDSMVVIITLNSSIDFTKQRSAEKYLANLCFTNNFVNFLRKFLQRIKKVFRYSWGSWQNTPVAKSYFSKVAGVYRSSYLRCSVKNGVLRKVFARFTGKRLCQRLIFNKGL